MAPRRAAPQLTCTSSCARLSVQSPAANPSWNSSSLAQMAPASRHAMVPVAPSIATWACDPHMSSSAKAAARRAATRTGAERSKRATPHARGRESATAASLPGQRRASCRARGTEPPPSISKHWQAKPQPPADARGHSLESMPVLSTQSSTAWSVSREKRPPHSFLEPPVPMLRTGATRLSATTAAARTVRARHGARRPVAHAPAAPLARDTVVSMLLTARLSGDNSGPEAPAASRMHARRCTRNMRVSWTSAVEALEVLRCSCAASRNGFELSRVESGLSLHLCGLCNWAPLLAVGRTSECGSLLSPRRRSRPAERCEAAPGRCEAHRRPRAAGTRNIRVSWTGAAADTRPWKPRRDTCPQ